MYLQHHSFWLFRWPSIYCGKFSQLLPVLFVGLFFLKKMQYFPLGFCLFECFSFGFWLFPMTINLLWKVFHNFLWIIPIWSNLLQCYLLFEGSIIYRCTKETFPRKTLGMVKVQTCAAGNMFWWDMKGAVMLEILV